MSERIMVSALVLAGSFWVTACIDDTEATEDVHGDVAAEPEALVGNHVGDLAEASDPDIGLVQGTINAPSNIDLVETAVSNPPATGAISGTFSVTDTAQNIGTAASGASVTKYFLSPDQLKNSGDTALTGSRSVAALAAGATSSGTVTVTIPAMAAGNYFVLACADGNASVSETDEGNNCKSSTTTIAIGGRDLIESFVRNPPATAVVGGTFQVRDSTQNIGTVGAPSTTTKYYLSADGLQAFESSFLASRVNVALVPNQIDSGTANATIPAGIAAGSYFLLACADRGPGIGPTSQVIETNENNNCSASATKVAISASDLTETNVTLAGTVQAGQPISVTETVANATSVAAGASKTRFYLSADAVKSSNDGIMWSCVGSGSVPQRSVPAIAANGSSTGTTALESCVVDSTGFHPVAPGTYFMIACADQTGAVGESNEKNNCAASGSFTVTP